MGGFLLKWANTPPAPGVDLAAITEREISEESEERVSDLARREAALVFVNRAGARLVAACPTCHGVAPEERYAVLVPQPNDTLEFRAALAVLKLNHLPVIGRRDPLAHLPTRCEHVREAR